MENYILYSLNDETGIRYIGITKQKLVARLANHISSCKQAFKNKKSRHHRHCWIKSLLDTDQKPTIIEIDTFTTAKDAKQAEIKTILYYKKHGFNLVNATSGGDGIRDYKFSKEHLEKVRHKVDQYSKDGILLKTFNSKTEAAFIITGKFKNDCKISQAVKGTYGRRTAFGYVWRNHGESFDLYPTTFQGVWSKSRREKMRQKQLTNNSMKGRIGLKNPISRPVVIVYNKKIKTITESVREAILEVPYGKSLVGKMLKTNEIINNYQLFYANKDIVQSLEKSKSSTLKTFVGQQYRT